MFFARLPFKSAYTCLTRSLNKSADCKKNSGFDFLCSINVRSCALANSVIAAFLLVPSAIKTSSKASNYKFFTLF